MKKDSCIHLLSESYDMPLIGMLENTRYLHIPINHHWRMDVHHWGLTQAHDWMAMTGPGLEVTTSPLSEGYEISITRVLGLACDWRARIYLSLESYDWPVTGGLGQSRHWQLRLPICKLSCNFFCGSEAMLACLCSLTQCVGTFGSIMCTEVLV